MKSAMTELKDKLQVVVDELADAKPQTDQYGYREAMQNVIKDIDAQMLEKERQQNIKCVFAGMKFMAEDLGEQESNYQIAEKVYTNTFTKKTNQHEISNAGID